MAKVKLTIEVGVDVSCYGNIYLDVEESLLKESNKPALIEHLSNIVKEQYKEDELVFDHPDWDTSSGLRMVKVSKTGKLNLPELEDVPIEANYYNVASGLIDYLQLHQGEELPDREFFVELLNKNHFSHVLK